MTEAAWMSFLPQRVQVTLSPWHCCPSPHPSHVLTAPLQKFKVLFLVMSAREKPLTGIHFYSQCMRQQLSISDHQHNHPSAHPQPHSIISFLVDSSSTGTGCTRDHYRCRVLCECEKECDSLDDIWSRKGIRCKEVQTREKKEKINQC